MVYVNSFVTIPVVEALGHALLIKAGGQKLCSCQCCGGVLSVNPCMGEMKGPSQTKTSN